VTDFVETGMTEATTMIAYRSPTGQRSTTAMGQWSLTTSYGRPFTREVQRQGRFRKRMHKIIAVYISTDGWSRTMVRGSAWRHGCE
jgi:hypothetical protein